ATQDEVKRLEALQQSTVDQLAEYKDLKDLDEAQVAKPLDERVPGDDALPNLRREIDRLGTDVIHMRADLDAPDRVRVWSWAEVPTKKDIRKQAAISGAAGLAGLGLVGGLISLYEL